MMEEISKLYNQAVLLLRCEKSLLSFRCFLFVIDRLKSVGLFNSFQNTPHIWIRLAECCIAFIESGGKENKKLEYNSDTCSSKNCFESKIISKGRSRRLLIS
jgi:hypothetical protein